MWWQEADDEAVAAKTTECDGFILWRWASGVAPADNGAEDLAEERGRSEPEPEQAAAVAAAAATSAARQPASTEDEESSPESSSVLWGDLQDTEWVRGTTGPIRNADLGALSATWCTATLSRVVFYRWNFSEREKRIVACSVLYRTLV